VSLLRNLFSSLDADRPCRGKITIFLRKADSTWSYESHQPGEEFTTILRAIDVGRHFVPELLLPR
jgi:hypothetical protein